MPAGFVAQSAGRQLKKRSILAPLSAEATPCGSWARQGVAIVVFFHQAHAVAARPVDCRLLDPNGPLIPMITTTAQNGRILADLTTHAAGPGVYDQ